MSFQGFGFGGTFGTNASGDYLQSRIASSPSVLTIAWWSWRNGSATNTTISKDSTDPANTEVIAWWNNTNARWELTIDFSGGAGLWSWTGGSATKTWHHHLLTIDTTSTSNNPSAWVDGAPATVTRRTAPSGTRSKVSDMWWGLGNRAGQDVAWDGILGAQAVWGRKLAPHEIALLGKGAPIDAFKRGLIYWVDPTRGNYELISRQVLINPQANPGQPKAQGNGPNVRRRAQPLSFVIRASSAS